MQQQQEQGVVVVVVVNATRLVATVVVVARKPRQANYLPRKPRQATNERGSRGRPQTSAEAAAVGHKLARKPRRGTK